MSYTDWHYIHYDPFGGDEAERTCTTVKIRTARKEHICFGSEAGPEKDAHTIKPGERYRHEKALIDGSFWGNYRICLNCLDKFLAEILGEEDDE